MKISRIDKDFCFSHRRGFGMLGLMSLIVLLGMLTAAVSISSMRSATGSLRGIQRLQTQAAAEGAAVLLATNDAPSSGTIQIGEARVLITPEPVGTDGATTATETATSATASHLLVSLTAGDRVIYTRNFRSVVLPPPGGVSVEALP